MKLSKLSKKVRWILVLPASVLAFFFCVIVIDLFPPDVKGDWLLFVVFVFCFLTGVMVAPLHGKRFVTTVASLFIFSCLFPPWRYVRDSAGYAFLFDPPHGVQIDFGRLFLEWAALAAVTGIIWMIVIKPTRPHDDKASQSSPSTDSPKN